MNNFPELPRTCNRPTRASSSRPSLLSIQKPSPANKANETAARNDSIQRLRMLNASARASRRFRTYGPASSHIGWLQGVTDHSGGTVVLGVGLDGPARAGRLFDQ